jgi:hypothetical protein
VFLSFIDLERSELHRRVANILNGFALGFVVATLFCNVIKMNFGLDPALPVKFFDKV